MFAGRYLARLLRSTYPPYLLFLSLIFTSIILILSLIYHGGRDTAFVPTIVGSFTLIYYLTLYVIHTKLYPGEISTSMFSFSEPRDQDGGPLNSYPISTIPPMFLSLANIVFTCTFAIVWLGTLVVLVYLLGKYVSNIENSWAEDLTIGLQILLAVFEVKYQCTLAFLAIRYRLRGKSLAMDEEV